jgi:hypothetical protein
MSILNCRLQYIHPNAALGIPRLSTCQLVCCELDMIPQICRFYKFALSWWKKLHLEWSQCLPLLYSITCCGLHHVHAYIYIGGSWSCLRSSKVRLDCRRYKRAGASWSNSFQLSITSKASYPMHLLFFIYLLRQTVSFLHHVQCFYCSSINRT